MKPIKRRTAPSEPERGEPESGAAGDVEYTRSEDRTEGLEGEEGGGGSYGNPRPSDADETSDRSQERG